MDILKWDAENELGEIVNVLRKSDQGLWAKEKPQV